jgi:phospholipase/carboxylesterase
MTRRLQPRSGAAKQLVVLCHGVGSDADDLIGLAPHWSGFVPDAAFVSPDGPEAYDMAPFGRQWFSLQDRSPAAMEAGARRAMPALLAFIEEERARLGVAAEQVAIMGFSQGAMMALFAGLRRAVPPAAILAFSGGLIAPEKLAAENTGAPAVLLVHGLVDEVVPASWTAESADALKAAGVPVQTLFCPELGHSIDEAGMLAGAQALRRAFP